jgi:hypothetical protein
MTNEQRFEGYRERYPFSLVFKLGDEASGILELLAATTGNQRAGNALNKETKLAAIISNESWEHQTTFHAGGITIGDPSVLDYPEQWNEIKDVRAIGPDTLQGIATFCIQVSTSTQE